jgi:hypothetical protein
MTASFCRELLLGPDHVRPAQRTEIGRYFVDLISKRDFPLHIANLWNALYFGWDPDEGGYIGPGLNPDRIVRRSFGAEDRAVPVGGFVKLANENMEVWGEVVYKEGRHPDADPSGDDFPAWVSGADAVATDGVVRVREALIVDWCAFGPTWNDATDLARLRRRGRLDEQGHLVMTALYEPDEADLDDAAYFARYLIEQHREGLLAEFVEDDATDEDLYTLLLVSLQSVADIAARTSGLILAARYVALEADYRDLVNDKSSGQITGHDFFQSVVTHLASVPKGESVLYSASGLAILEHLSRGEGIDASEAHVLEGPGYARLVTYINLFVADALRTAENGLIRRYDDGPFHLRLDDAWQWGGVWRSEHIEHGRLPSYAYVPPLVPLGLGADEQRRRNGATIATPAARPAAEIVISSDRKQWRVTLTDRDIDEGMLPLGAAESLLGRRAGAPFRLKIGVEDRRAHTPIFNDCVQVDPRRHVITGVKWGFEAFAGVHLYCSAARDGLSMWAEFRPLVRPQSIGGVEYEFEFGGRPLPRAKAKLSTRELARTATLRDAVALAFRHRGEVLPDGRYAASLIEIARAIVGPAVATGFLSLVSHEVRLMGLQEDAEGRYLWHPIVRKGTRSTDSTLLGTFSQSAGGIHLARHIRPHGRRMHLRRWQHKDPADWERRALEYPSALARFRCAGVRHPALPAGYTWVSEHIAPDAVQS